MKKKIILFTSLLCLVLVLTVFITGLLAVKTNNLNQAKDNAKNMAVVVSKLYTGNDDAIKEFDEDYRITIIDSNGKVLADSEYADVSTMENHIDREEIVSALNGTGKAVVRDSATTGKQMIYFALKKESSDFDNGYVFIRISVEVESVNAYFVKTVVPMVIMLFVALGFAVLLSVFMASKVTKPLLAVKNGLNDLNEGRFHGFELESNDSELLPLLASIDDIGKKFDSAFSEAKYERDRLSVIVESINDGIVVFDGTSIVFVNTVAKKLFDCTDEVVGKKVSALTSSVQFINACESAKLGQVQGFEEEISHRIILVTFKQIKDSGFTLAVFTDLTAERNNQKLRSEFFANASHELKTPLTAITGFNDLIIQSDELQRYSKFTTQIKSNSQRMLSLVDDMLKLSELENNTDEKQEIVDIGDVAKRVKEDLSVIADEKNVKISVEGNASMQANENKIYDLLKNLVENAVKYNDNKGYAKLNISEDKYKVLISVEDDGIGIDEKDVQRIFERFYRVEKSRSRATGGTGLGLSIVKHIVHKYNGEIALKSRLGVGTTISISFPKI